MSGQAQPATCRECRVVFSAGSLGTSGSLSVGSAVCQETTLAYYVVEPCSLHAQAERMAKELAFYQTTEKGQLRAQAEARLKALERIASTLREDEPLEGTYQERCQRSPAAAFTMLDSLIVIAREAVQEPTATRPHAAAGGGAG